MSCPFRRVTTRPPALVRSSDLIRRLIVAAIIVATLTISWQFLRAWLALFLQDYHGYSKEATRGLMSGYFIAADIGCLLSGVLVTRFVGPRLVCPLGATDRLTLSLPC